MTFVDTNYFLRLLLKDSSAQEKKAKKLFQKGAMGKVKLFTSSMVIFEIFWVLKSFYQKPKMQIINILEGVLSLEFVKLEERSMIRKALEIYKITNLELEDCYNIAYAEKKKYTDFATFDTKIISFLKKTNKKLGK